MTKISGGRVGFDGNAAELAELQQQLALNSVRGMTGESAEAQLPGRVRGRADRRGAQTGMMGQQATQLAAMAARATALADEGPEKQALVEQLQKMGYLPKPPAQITEKMFEDASRKAITDHLGDIDPSLDAEQLMSLIESMLMKKNAGANGGGGARSGGSTQRPGMLPPASTYANRGPAPNQGALQQQAAQSVATANPPPEPGSINARVAEATQRYMGTSTAAGPDGGNLACAWSVNNILSNAGLSKVGSNPNYVPSVEQALQGGRGTAINASDARPGDIVIWPNGHHIGIYMGDGKVANNSSSRAAFVNMSNLPAGARVYRLNS
jgi:cell wall-associated NlpC family hydrolase